MTFFKRRAMRRNVKHMLHEARHTRHMRGDLMGEDELRALCAAEEQLHVAWSERSEEKLEAAAQALSESIGRAYPQRKHAGLSEHLEILIVAVAVAMAFRTYFIQPFKIPTGSMQPTLFGIQVEPQEGRGLSDRLPLNLVKMALFGERYKEVKAPISGQLRHVATPDENSVYRITGVDGISTLKMHKDMRLKVNDGAYVSKGQILASALMRHGDHIFVDKVRYNFSRPKRGNIFVFSTDTIPYENIRPDSFYIKRLVGLPGETISVVPPHLMVNGNPITEPYPFKRMLEDPGYRHDPGCLCRQGYALANSRSVPRPKLMRPDDRLLLGAGEYLPMGDNTLHSLDGRYFGPVEQSSVVGPAFMIYWPFGHRWGISR